MAEVALENGVPVTAGWFVVNVRDARWLHSRMRSWCRFGGEGAAHFDDLRVSLFWLSPGCPMSLYHHEAGQEDFLVLTGDCKLVIEGEDPIAIAYGAGSRAGRPKSSSTAPKTSLSP